MNAAQFSSAAIEIGRRESTAPPRLVSDFEAQYLKFKGKEPCTLEEVAIARADLEHSRRVAEIKAMSKRLAALQEFVPHLLTRGIRLADRKIATWDHGQTLRIESPMFGKDEKLLAALLELGFSEVERSTHFRDEEAVTVKHGRWLRVQVTVARAPRAAL